MTAKHKRREKGIFETSFTIKPRGFKWHPETAKADELDANRIGAEIYVDWALDQPHTAWRLEHCVLNGKAGMAWCYRDYGGGITQFQQEDHPEAKLNGGPVVYGVTVWTVSHTSCEGESAGSRYIHWYNADGTEGQAGYDGIRAACKHVRGERNS